MSAGWSPAHILQHVTNFHDNGAVKRAFAMEVQDRIGPMVAAATGWDGEFVQAMGPIDVLQKFFECCMDVPSVLALANITPPDRVTAAGEETFDVLLRVSDKLVSQMPAAAKNSAGGPVPLEQHGPCSVEEDALLSKARLQVLQQDPTFEDRQYIPRGWKGHHCHSPPGSPAVTNSQFIRGSLFRVSSVMWSFTSLACDAAGEPCVWLRFDSFQDQVAGAVEWYPEQHNNQLHGGVSIYPTSVRGVVSPRVWGYVRTGSKEGANPPLRPAEFALIDAETLALLRAEIKVDKAALEKKTVPQLKTEAIRQGLALHQPRVKKELVTFIQQSSLHNQGASATHSDYRFLVNSPPRDGVGGGLRGRSGGDGVEGGGEE